jgi:thioredoxin 1
MKTLFDQINGGDTILVHFFTTWSGTCKMINPILKKFKKEFCDCVKIEDVNLDRDHHLIEHFKIIRLPTIILFKNREEVWSNEGIVGVEEIKLAYQEHDVCNKFRALNKNKPPTLNLKQC